MSLETGVKGAVNGATQSRAVEWTARAGYPISGVLYLLIAYVIVRIALGFGGDADQTGALATLASSGGGALPLWIVAAGLIALAMWRFAETVLGLHPGECTDADKRESPISHRLKAFGLALVYCAVAFTAIQFAMDVGRQGSGLTAGLSARLMQSDGGKAVLVIVGMVMAVIGGYYVHKGATRKFLKDLTARGGRLITVLGVCGHVAEGSVLFAAGLSVMVATYLSDPAKATASMERSNPSATPASVQRSCSPPQRVSRRTACTASPWRVIRACKSVGLSDYGRSATRMQPSDLFLNRS